jgi:hypothetical protein
MLTPIDMRSQLHFQRDSFLDEIGPLSELMLICSYRDKRLDYSTPRPYGAALRGQQLLPSKMLWGD